MNNKQRIRMLEKSLKTKTKDEAKYNEAMTRAHYLLHQQRMIVQYLTDKLSQYESEGNLFNTLDEWLKDGYQA